MFLKINNKRQGSAFAFVLIAFMIVSIIGSSILFIFNSNLKQAKRQQDSMEAYYLAYSGAEMAYASLMTIESSGTFRNKYKFKRITDNNETFTENNIVYGNGKISVIAQKADEENFENWVEITSTAILNKNNLTYTRTLYFDPDNPVDRVWIN
jgi:type II secretory pathway component PulK